MPDGIHARRYAYPALTPLSARDVRFSDLRDMAADLSAVDQVIAPLFGDGFDAHGLIQLLGQAGFTGRLCVMADPLPNRGMVLRELRAVAGPQGIDVDLRERRVATGGLAAKLLRRLRG